MTTILDAVPATARFFGANLIGRGDKPVLRMMVCGDKFTVGALKDDGSTAFVDGPVDMLRQLHEESRELLRQAGLLQVAAAPAPAQDAVRLLERIGELQQQLDSSEGARSVAEAALRASGERLHAVGAKAREYRERNEQLEAQVSRLRELDGYVVRCQQAETQLAQARQRIAELETAPVVGAFDKSIDAELAELRAFRDEVLAARKAQIRQAAVQLGVRAHRANTATADASDTVEVEAVPAPPPAVAQLRLVGGSDDDEWLDELIRTTRGNPSRAKWAVKNLASIEAAIAQVADADGGWRIRELASHMRCNVSWIENSLSQLRQIGAIRTEILDGARRRMTVLRPTQASEAVAS